ncbi:cysteine--tRNA ligase [Nitrospiraceae bacterium AH_259_D15_M11_P09]|nr:cysteine--tRNA ligase [Nitrospiraceae bacterium AH_259_D15_M11_P09]
MLKLYNTMTGSKEAFQPLVPGTVRMYVCGVTVYDESHLGHARSALVFDVLRNYLQFSGYAVTFVKNFTDVDDKILTRAAQEGVPWTEIVERYLCTYRRDMARLGVAPADIEPKATEHMPEITTMIEALMAKGHAYRLNGDVYFEVGTDPAYGRLSKRKPEDLLAGARVEVDERKRNPMDFALWKSSKAGEPAWESPWGPGRPGWHIECSAMSIRHLGETFDIHGGGMDLIFPHHENEIAQSCAATGKEFARYWLHNGFVQINDEKMSKSLGNFFTIREIFEKSGHGDKVTAEALRYLLLSTHYRNPLDFSDDSLWEAKRTLDSLYGLFQRLDEPSRAGAQGDAFLISEVDRLGQAFRHAMDDDFNTPVAIAQFQRLRGEINKLLETGLSRRACNEAQEAFRRFGKILGLFQLSYRDREWEFKDLHPPTGWMDTTTQAAVQAARTQQWHPAYGETSGQPVMPSFLRDEEVEQRLAERNEARRRKDFARADAIRTELSTHGITIEDRPDGTSRWKR